MSRPDPARISGIFQPVEIDLPMGGEPWRGRVHKVTLPWDGGEIARVELISEDEYQRRFAGMNGAA